MITVIEYWVAGVKVGEFADADKAAAMLVTTADNGFSAEFRIVTRSA